MSSNRLTMVCRHAAGGTRKTYVVHKKIFLGMEAMEDKLSLLLTYHETLVSSIPTADEVLQICRSEYFATEDGRSSRLFVNAMTSGNVDDLDTPLPEDANSINIGQCCSFSPKDTSDMCRLAQKIVLFPDDFMQKMQVLVSNAHTTPQVRFANLFRNFPYALYLVLLNRILSKSSAETVTRALSGSADHQKILTMPGLMNFTDWRRTLVTWNRSNVNSVSTKDDTDLLNSLLEIEQIDLMCDQYLETIMRSAYCQTNLIT